MNEPTPGRAMTEVPAPEGLVVNILIVDDEPRNLSVLESVLDDPGYRLVRATSGEQALLALMADEFAVLVLDVRMPGMTGFELAQMIKERKKTSRIPIIFLTAYYNEDQHILEGYGTGAVDYLHKPVNPSVLRSKVAVFAELHRKGTALEAANRLLLGEVAERRRAEERLSELNASLDRRVTERTSELEVSQARLLEANRRKDEFLATLAHELRNPLAPVRNAVQLLKRGLPPDRLAWATDLVDRQVSALARLIDDLMDVSRINQGRVELRRERVALKDVIADALETVKPVMEQARHEFQILLPDDNLEVEVDRTRMAQAFTNLLHNAAKYTEPGGRVELAVAVEKDRVVVSVLDSGIGIPADSLDSIFEMFSQVESALSRSRGGLGIGLALTERLVRLHGGTVRASSDGLGKGSRFQVALPLATEARVPEAPPGDAPQVEAGDSLRILVADDNVDGAETLTMLLQALGHVVHTVHDGEAAYRAAAQFLPDAVLLDIGMPKMNGYDACRAIRKSGHPCFLVALTGWGQPQDVQRAMEAGFDRHLVKPVDPAGLLSILAPVRPAARGSMSGAG